MPRRPVDEGPSEEDLRRFGDETAYCPDCGAEVWDGADVCPKCFAYLGGDTSRHRPIDRWWRSRWKIVIVAVLIIVLSGFGFVLLRQH